MTTHEIPPAGLLITAPGDGEHLWFATESMTIKASAATTGGALMLIETLAPAGQGPPLHVHHDEHEAFYVLAGELDLACGDQRYLAGPGTFAFLPRGVAHTWRVTGQAPARFLTLAVPGGLENFFREAGRAAERPGLPPAGPVDIAAITRVGERHNNQVVGPPLDPR
jgi:mannose-6-phosphate isomerase-like protein (cupin superfamily)